jgi:gluconolactonase
MSYEVVAEGLKFPEGPICMPDGSIVLVEIAAGRLSRVHADGSVDVIAELGGGPNGAAIGPDGACYVCNNGGFTWVDNDGLLFPEGTPDDYDGGRIERVDLATGKFETLYTECDGIRLNGPNDIVFDSSGGFWFTDAGKLWPRKIARGGVYYAAADGIGIREVFYPLEFANGVALSPAEDRLYFAETMNGRIWQYPLSGPGQVDGDIVPGNPENLLHAPGGIRGFDSMAVDSGGYVCQATLFEGGISVVSPEGELAEFITFPDPLVTNICFGGDDMSTAYITLSATGQLVRMPWPRPGLRLNFADR